MTAFRETLERFRRMAAGSPADVPLARAALLVAQGEHPDLDIDAYEQRIQEMASTLEARTHPSSEPAARIEAANDLIFKELGFRADEEQTPDPSTHLLDSVLERRIGVPVTLTILYAEVCQRAGLSVHGVGLPGRVLARLGDAEGKHLFIDVATGGRILTAEDCRTLVSELLGRRFEFRDHFLSNLTPRQLIQRLLHVMKADALQRGDEERAARAIEFLLALFPWDLDELRDRGMLRERIGNYPSALDDLEQYVRFRQGARDIQTVTETVRTLRRHTGADTG